MDKRICLITSCVLILSYAVVGRDFRTEAEEKSYVTINEVENINLSFTNLEENQDHIPSQVDEGIEGSKDNLPMSTRLEVEFAFNLERTSENPLRGFYTNYDWGEPVNDFPDSLEFAYIPLSNLMSGPSSFTFDTGLEPSLIAAESRSHQLVLRPYVDYPSLKSGLPDFLSEKVQMQPYTVHGGGLSPDYNDPALQAALLSFIKSLGQRYDGDPRLAVIQLGLLGFWGEWHTWPHDKWFPNDDFQSKVINSYAESFTITLLQVRRPIANTPNLRIGFHDDSFAYSTLGDLGWYFHPSLIEAGADDRWGEVSIGGELRPELQNIIFENNYDNISQSFDRCVRTTHISMLLNYSIYSGGLNSSKERIRAETAALSLGYAIHISKVKLLDNVLGVTLENRGVAPFYPSLFLQVEDSIGINTRVKLTRITTDQGPQKFYLNVCRLNPPGHQSPWTLSLQSDYVLPSQKILFATEPGQGLIRVE